MSEGSGLQLLAQHTAAVASALTAGTFVVLGLYNWLITRGGLDAFNTWLESKAADEREAAAKQVCTALKLTDKDPHGGVAMLSEGMEAFRSATARGTSRRRAVSTCQRAFMLMCAGCVGLWLTLVGAPQWMQAIPFLTWVGAVTVGTIYFIDLFRFVTKTGGPPANAKAASPAPAPSSVQMGDALPTGLRMAETRPVASVAVEPETGDRKADAGQTE